MSVDLHPQYVWDENGTLRSVMLSAAEYRALLEAVEDSEDSQLLEKLIAESTGSRSLEDVFKELDAESA